MPDVSRLSTLRFALQSDEYDFSSTPGTLTALRPTDDATSFLPRARTALARGLRSLSGRRYQHIRGPQDTGDLTVALEFRGVSGNGAAAVSDWEAVMEQGGMLASMFGAVAPATTGTAPTVAASGHTPASGILGVSSTTLVTGEVIGFPTSDGFEVGKIASGGGSTAITLEHPYTGTPTTGGQVVRFAVYTVDDDLTEHTHCFFSAEGETWRRDYKGCAPMSMALAMAGGTAVAFSSVWSPTSWSDVAEANPAHADPTSGSPVVVDFCRLWFAGIALAARDFSISYSNAMTSRRADNKANGRLGGVAATGDGKEYKIEFSVYVGANDAAADGQYEIEDTSGSPSLADLLGATDAAGDVSTTREVALQVGTEAGSLLYGHMPTADVQVTTQVVDGLTMARVVCIGTGAVPGILAVG